MLYGNLIPNQLCVMPYSNLIPFWLFVMPCRHVAQSVNLEFRDIDKFVSGKQLDPVFLCTPLNPSHTFVTDTPLPQTHTPGTTLPLFYTSSLPPSPLPFLTHTHTLTPPLYSTPPPVLGGSIVVVTDSWIVQSNVHTVNIIHQRDSVLK